MDFTDSIHEDDGPSAKNVPELIVKHVGPRTNSRARLMTSKMTKSQSASKIVILSHIHYYQAHLFNVEDLDQVKQYAPTLLDLQIHQSSLKGFRVIQNCKLLIKLSLNENGLKQIPLLVELTNLIFLDLSDNFISNLKRVDLPQSILWLNLENNPIQKLTNYRLKIIQTFQNLVLLDTHFIADIERTMDRYPETFKLSSNYQIPSFLFRTQLCSSGDEMSRYLNTQIKYLTNISKSLSQIRKLQKFFRFAKSKLSVMKLVKPIIRFQSIFRANQYRKQLATGVDELAKLYGINNYLIHPKKNRVTLDHAVRRVQTLWRSWYKITKRLRTKQRQAVKIIISWYRKVIRYHKGLCLWMKIHKNNSIYLLESTFVTFSQFLKSTNRRLPAKIYQIQKHMVQYSDILMICSEKIGKIDKKHPYFLQNKVDLTTQNTNYERLSRFYSTRLIPNTFLSHATNTQKRMLLNLHRRGVGQITVYKKLLDSTKIKRRKSKTQSLQDIIPTKFKLIKIELSDYSLLVKFCRIIQYCEYPNKKLRIFSDVTVRNSLATVLIQKCWRGVRVRLLKSRILIQKILIQRSILCIQRWWRTRNGLLRRFYLLKSICSVCEAINSPVLYLDLLIYFKFLSTSARPIHQRSVVNKFPEYKCVPSFDINGKLIIQSIGNQIISESKPMPPDRPLSAPNFRRRNTENQANRLNVRSRLIPRWPSWSPMTQLLQSNEFISDREITFSLLTKSCSISIDKFPLSNAIAISESHSIDFHLVELTFNSVKEARVRCAMFMLLTFDPKTWLCLQLYQYSDVLARLKINAKKILNFTKSEQQPSYQPLQLSNSNNISSSDISPIESKVILCDYFLRFDFLSAKEIINFNFFYKSLLVNRTLSQEPNDKLKFMDTSEIGDVENNAIGVTHTIKFDKIHEVGLTSVPLSSAAKPTGNIVVNTLQKIEEDSADIRFLRHIWSSNRLISWCSQNNADPHLLTNADIMASTRIELLSASQKQNFNSKETLKLRPKSAGIGKEQHQASVKKKAAQFRDEATILRMQTIDNKHITNEKVKKKVAEVQSRELSSRQMLHIRLLEKAESIAKKKIADSRIIADALESAENKRNSNISKTVNAVRVDHLRSQLIARDSANAKRYASVLNAVSKYGSERQRREIQDTNFILSRAHVAEMRRIKSPLDQSMNKPSLVSTKPSTAEFTSNPNSFKSLVRIPSVNIQEQPFVDTISLETENSVELESLHPTKNQLS